MGGVRLNDPLEQFIIDNSRIEQLTVDDLRNATPAVFAQMDRLNEISDRIYVHVDMDVLDPREVEGTREQGPERTIERAAGYPVRDDLPPLPEGFGTRHRLDPLER